MPEGETRLLAVSDENSDSTYQASGGTKQSLGSTPSETRVDKWVTLFGAPKSAELNGSALLSAIHFQRMESDWASGLFGISCQRPSNDFWLVGGETRTGREALLVLTNSANVDATIELTILGSSGVVSVAGLSGISVPKHHTTVLPMNGLIPDTETFAVRVQARGGAVGGWLQQRAVRGTKAAGLDWIAPAAEAAKELSIPGFLVRGVKDAKALQDSGSAYSDISNFVRIVNPTNQEATVLVRVAGATASTFGTVIQQKVSANSASDVAVTGLSDGDFTIFVSSDQPVLAAAKLNRTNLASTPNTDFTWLPALAPSSGRQVIPVPSVGIAKVAIVNPSNQPAAVSLKSGNSSQNLRIPASGVVIVKVDGGLLSLDSQSLIAASIVLDVRGSITSFPMVEYRNLGGSVSVIVQ